MSEELRLSGSSPLLSVILPMYNADKWIEECLMSILKQSYSGPIEVCIYDDGSTDNSGIIAESFRQRFEQRKIALKVQGHSGKPTGVGHAKNRAVAVSSGEFLCFLDADDVMHEDRLLRQLELSQQDHRAIVGCRFHRECEDSTKRFTQWANRLSPQQLYLQAFTSHGPTLIMPTWFCHKDVFTTVGGFHEGGKGIPEDLIFFYRHLEEGGRLCRADEDLLMYRYHPDCATFSVLEQTIWDKRVQFMEKRVLSAWDHFSIWNAGKQGRKLYRSLSQQNREKVTMFCDVDDKKIQKKFYIYEESKQKPKPKVPICHFTKVRPPIVICIKLDLCGNFEQNLSSLRLKEGRDYIHFN